ncbi:MAG: hypothetical protein F7B20_01610 [Aeropyrum sp.]|nr:hypothetical protein [Aeropyrum sp.]MCE4616863.1 hypothetical protein [Aeropyrum sp.]
MDAILRITSNDNPENLARRLAVILNDGKQLKLRASGNAICTLFDTLRILQELTRSRIQIKISTLKPVFRGDSRETVIILEVTRVLHQ